MRIGYDHQIFGWQRFGGVSRYFYELGNGLAGAENSAIQCRIVSPFYVNDYLQHSSPLLEVKGCHIPSIPHTGRLYRKVNEWIAPLFFRLWHPDLVHETYYSRSSVAPKGCRTVLTVFDMIHELYPEYFPSWDPTREEKKVAVARADHIICISEHTKSDLVRLLGVPEEKITVIHLGFSLSIVKPFNLPPPRKPFLLYVGSRGGYKNFERLVEAYASQLKLRDSYDLVAFGGGGFTDKEMGLIQSFGLSEMQVRQVSGDDGVLGGLYRQAALFVYPSLYEGFGIPPLEAMSFGCPVVCSNTSSIPEVVGDAALQFDPLCSESIGEAIQQAIGDRVLQEGLRERGRARIRFFSWQECALKTLDVYRKVLG